MECVTSKTDPKLSSTLNFQTTTGRIWRISNCVIVESRLRNTDASTTPLLCPERTHSSILACNTAFLYNHALSCPNWLQSTCFSSPLPSGNVIKMFQRRAARALHLFDTDSTQASTNTRTIPFLSSRRTFCLWPPSFFSLLLKKEGKQPL